MYLSRAPKTWQSWYVSQNLVGCPGKTHFEKCRFVIFLSWYIFLVGGAKQNFYEWKMGSPGWENSGIFTGQLAGKSISGGARDSTLNKDEILSLFFWKKYPEYPSYPYISPQVRYLVSICRMLFCIPVSRSKKVRLSACAYTVLISLSSAGLTPLSSFFKVSVAHSKTIWKK